MIRNYITITDESYLTRFLALHRSMIKRAGPFFLWVLTLDRESKKVARTLPNVSVVKLKLIEEVFEPLYKVKAKRPWLQYIFTVKPHWMLYVLGIVDNLCYIDADSFFFSKQDSMFDEIGNASLAITPHNFSKSYHKYLRKGVYNAGFIYVANSGRKCIQHWANQCVKFCSRVESKGHHDDQTYLNDWSKRWGAHVIGHKGVNLGPWGQGEGNHTYEMRGKHIYVDGYPLVFYHFHEGLTTGYPLDPFVSRHIYWKYRKAIKRAKRKLMG